MKYLLLFLTIFAITMLSFAQSSYQIAKEKPATVTIKGTSTLHDWSVKSKTVTGYPNKISLTVRKGEKVKFFAFNVKVSSMDGGRGVTMNDKIYAALKSDKHPYIKYKQSGTAKIGSKNDKLYLYSKGILEMAGVKRSVSVLAYIEKKGNTLIFSGKKTLKMSDFKIDPPSAMFGQIQTYDKVTVEFQFQYKLL